MVANNQTKPYVVGVDVGGTNTVFGIVDANGTIIKRGHLKSTDHINVDDYIGELASAIIDSAKDVGSLEQIHAVGVGAPNANYFTGTIDYPCNLRWPSHIPFAHLLSTALYGIPVVLNNDANAAAIGEMRYGAAKGIKDFIEITLGTGLGSGIVTAGKVLYGHNGLAGEIGHVTIRHHGRPCGCGKCGCLETYCSATGVAKTAKEFLESGTEDSLLRHLSPRNITSRDVYEAALAGDRLALDVFEVTGKYLGITLANVVPITDPEAIILFGGLTKAGEMLLAPTRRHMEENLLKPFKNRVKLLISGLKESDAALLGAAAIGWGAD